MNKAELRNEQAPKGPQRFRSDRRTRPRGKAKSLT